MEEKYTIADKIIILRKRDKLKQKDLAKLLGIAPTTLSDYEHNRSFPPLKVLLKLCDIFEVPMDFFYYDYQLKQNTALADDIQEGFDIPVLSFTVNNDGSIEQTLLTSKSAPSYLSQNENYFYFTKNDTTMLFQHFSNADYLDTLIAFTKENTEPDIFKAVKKDNKILFLNNDKLYTQDELNIIGVLYEHKAYRKFIIDEYKENL